MINKTALFAAASALALSGAAQAEVLPRQAGQAGPVAQVADVVVTADPLGRSRDDVVSNVVLVSGDDLVHRRQATLGETLSGVPGVNSDTFGAGASRPVIRGQTAPRVKVLSDGAALIDASEVSPDHAVSGEPLLLEGIEILRGPSALLYGGGAIGGAVNLIDRKVPTAIPGDGGDGVAEVRLGTADDERAGVVGATVGAGNFALRIEAAARRTDDYRLPFYTPPRHDEDEGHDHDHAHEEDEGFNRLAGSFNRTRTATLGASWIGSRGYLGAAFTEQQSRYGLPGHSHEYESCHPHGSSLHCGGHDHGEDDHDHDHDHGEEGHVPVVDLISRRVDLRGELRNPFAGVERVRFRGGYTDYRHDEIDDGEVSTTFTNKGHDLRLEVQHAPIGGLRGVIGVQSSDTDFAAVGAESFIPPSNTKSSAIFLLEEYVMGDWRFEGALRQEWQETSALGRPDVEHKPFSASLGANWAFTPGYAATFNVARSQRAPHVQELYAHGVHLATNTFELGTATLGEETAVSLEIGLRKTEGPLTFSASAYRYAYDGYIYAQTLDQFEDFRLIRYAQEDATFTGVEGDIRYAFSPNLSASVFGDYVRASLDEGGALPRIPAARLGARTDLFQGPWSGSLEYIRVFEQDRIADFERETPGYNMVNATVAYDFDIGGFRNQVFVRGSNLLDETALNHASFISTLAPMRGRNVVLGLRTRF
ncbi:TonB-dependent receptor [Brevundimonas sp. S30B]|uniref:TonB-dependent receptor domain-containing protein n=1 Tax=unclassified Brevundimonas TaxID=2622653 RepID=UPI001071823B|nr:MULTISPECIES: TonB-dependent receptor [unclassified Brevundimonas]QBX37698.1 TonB-dependent receptor [Brevundimonas sp. MF30-B]TFW00562.1 TonB-dependent receptor [Brevundimonas sp. S30B]